MDQSNKKKAAAGIAAAIIIALLLNTVIIYTKNSKLKESVNKEKLQTEKLLSEKLLLSKQIDEFGGEISSLMGKNKEADILLETTNRNLNAQEAKINSLAKEAADAKHLRKQLKNVQQIRENLMTQLQKLNESKEELSNNNKELKDKNEVLTKDFNNLLAENKTLTEQLRAKSFTGSNFKIEVLKDKKDKLTVKGKRTEKVKIEFEIPSNTYPVDANLIHVDLLSPEKSLPTGKTEVTVKNQAQLSASLNQSPLNEEAQKVIIKYTPDEKLKQGVYTVLVYHKNTFLGKAQFRLMK